MSDNCIVYMAVNKQNGHCYVGLTSGPLKRRMSEHKHCASRGDGGCKRLNRALRKYGFDAFLWRQVKSGLSRADAAKEEVRLISDLKAEYNISAGGEFGIIGVKRTPEWNDKIRVALKGKPWTDAQRKSGDKRSYLKARKPVICINDDTIFGSLKEAAKAYGIRSSSISGIIGGKEKSIKGLIFRFADKPYSDEERQKILDDIAIYKLDTAKRSSAAARKAHRKSVVCLDDGKIYDCAVTAAKAYDTFQSCISSICLGKQKTTKGLRFAFVEESVQ